jgi:CubicO group peptidase (beta-lactamase class C family)
MKDHKLLLSQWMVTGIIIMIVTMMPHVSLATDAPLKLSSQYWQALQLSAKKDDDTDTESLHSEAMGYRDYFRKKYEYYTFLNTYIKEKRQELGAEGISVSVISENDLLFLKGFGYADKESQTNVTPLTLFRVGSVSKLMTGIAIMTLVEQGKIDLDAPVENYIPGFSYKTHYPDAKLITVRNLMTHQSGIVGDIFKGRVSAEEQKYENSEVVNLINDEYVAYPTGYISSYSNIAVSLLGIIIEEVSGVGFEEYIKDNIFRPIGMFVSDFSMQFYMHPILAKSYDHEGVAEPFLYVRDKPAASLISNSLEMSLFMRMILNGGELFGQRIVKESTLEQMFVQQNKNIELDFPQDHGDKWGLSWVLNHPILSSVSKYAGHRGSIQNYFTQLHILPEHGLGVIVETNSTAEFSTDVADTAMVKALEIFKGIKQPDTFSRPPIVPLTQNHVQQASGTYATNNYGLLSIYPKDYSLFATSSALGDIEFELKPHADNWFSVYQNDQPIPGYENIRITVKNGKHERFVGIQRYGANGSISSSPEGVEYEIPEELPTEWLNRVGLYSVINGDSDDSSLPIASIQVLRPGVLSFTLLGEFSTVLGAEMSGTSYLLDTVNEDEAIRVGRGRSINETIQVVDCGAEECLYQLGLLMKKLPDPSASAYRQGVFSTNDIKKEGED